MRSICSSVIEIANCFDRTTIRAPKGATGTLSVRLQLAATATNWTSLPAVDPLRSGVSTHPPSACGRPEGQDCLTLAVLASDVRPRLTGKSSARNTIETVFCLRRNHISGSALNVTSQQMTKGRRVPAERVLTIPGAKKRKLL